MNKVLMKKCDKLIKAADHNTLFYDDILKEISANKDLMKYSCTIPNALEYIEKAGIMIVDNSTIAKEIESAAKDDHEITVELEVESTIEEDNVNDIDNTKDIMEELSEEPNEDDLEKNLEDIVEYEDAHNYYVGDNVELYLKSVGYVQTRLLTVDEERELCLAAQAGDIEARNKMISHNLKLVISIAKRYNGVNSSLEYNDLIQSGNMGLIKAIDRFEPDKGFKFSTYATWWIRQSITRSMADEGRNIRLPVHAVEQLRYINKAITEIKAFNNDTEMPSFKEIADYCNEHGYVVKTNPERVLTEETVTSYMSLAKNSDTVSLYTKIGEDEHGQETCLGDFIADSKESVESEILRNDLRRKFEFIFDNYLTSREAKVLRLRFGFEGEPMTLEQVGQIFGVTRERIRQIEHKALKKIRTKSSINRLLI